LVEAVGVEPDEVKLVQQLQCKAASLTFREREKFTLQIYCLEDLAKGKKKKQKPTTTKIHVDLFFEDLNVYTF
jgi:hypothetical protein